MKTKLTAIFAFACAVVISATVQVKDQATSPGKVAPETYIRAETDRTFLNLSKQAGGVNRLFHFRSPTPLDKQTVVRMNKDTLYFGCEPHGLFVRAAREFRIETNKANNHHETKHCARRS